MVFVSYHHCLTCHDGDLAKNGKAYLRKLSFESHFLLLSSMANLSVIHTVHTIQSQFYLSYFTSVSIFCF